MRRGSAICDDRIIHCVTLGQVTERKLIQADRKGIMSLLGKAALAMWWDMSPDVNTEFQDWHSHEHFRERLAIPGFLRATR